jgi:hypothetical protein
MKPVVERHYTFWEERTTENFSLETHKITRETYENAGRTATEIGDAQERSLGKVKDQTRYYNFSGNNLYLRQGMVQVGIAKTSDNQEGFEMIRLFTNSTDDMHSLQARLGLPQT